jgi:hypothetical protein
MLLKLSDRTKIGDLEAAEPPITIIIIVSASIRNKVVHTLFLWMAPVKVLSGNIYLRWCWNSRNESITSDEICPFFRQTPAPSTRIYKRGTLHFALVTLHK